jgi:hypothetical protein
MTSRFETPVALIIFNRPEQTRRVFETLQNVKPKVLLIIADGPRDDVSRDKNLVAQCRDIVSEVSWDCEVHTNFSSTNLGCRSRISSGLDWVFSLVDEAIILEDDCLPSTSFFLFISEMLNRYRDDLRIGSVSGFNALAENENKSKDSYGFTGFPTVWGWGTWKRVWDKYDVNLEAWPQLKDSNLLSKAISSRNAVSYWNSALEGVYRNRIDTWDYQLTFLHWLQGWLSVVPYTNLVSNIGFGKDATHTLDTGHALANVSNDQISFPLTHPTEVSRDLYHDLRVEKLFFERPAIKNIIGTIFDALPSPLQRLSKRIYSRTRK